MKNLPSIAEVQAGMSVEFQSFFQIVKMNTELITWQIVESFWAAVDLCGRVLFLSRPCKIILDTSPFGVNVGNGILAFTPNDNVYGLAVSNLVFIDLKKFACLSQNLQIAIILEEFVHAMMDVKDENLASEIVANIYPNIKYINGKYVVP